MPAGTANWPESPAVHLPDGPDGDVPSWGGCCRAVGKLIDQGVNRRPVMDQAGKPLGVLARHDALRAVAGPNQLPSA